MKQFHVYVMSNASRTLYIGVTNSLERRVWEHKHKRVPGFTSRYNVTRLVYSETFTSIRDAMIREKQLKGWNRGKKIAVIEQANPEWSDLSAEWLSPEPTAP